MIKNRELTEEREIDNDFNTFFTNTGPELAGKIENASKPFKNFIGKVAKTMATNSVTINELKEAFFSLKINKNPGYDEINFNVIKNCFGKLSEPLKHRLICLCKGEFSTML